MAVITFSHKGNFHKTFSFLKNDRKSKIKAILDKYGVEGVNALSAATPERTGKTANSWRYEVSADGDTYRVTWINDNVNKGICIAVILQYGHGTGTGGYVQGIDYINPAMNGVFDRMATEAWEEVRDA